MKERNSKLVIDVLRPPNHYGYLKAIKKERKKENTKEKKGKKE